MIKKYLKLLYRLRNTIISTSFCFGRKKHKYYIIRFEDRMHCGWTVWERVVLFNSIYAIDHGYIPVVDMQSKKNIYLENDEVGIVNAWDKYYLQPVEGVSLTQALQSGDYILGNESQEWFDYIRIRKRKLKSNEYLRRQYQLYIKYNDKTERRLSTFYNNMLKKANRNMNVRLLGVCLRGRDYRQFGHAINPIISEIKPDIDRALQDHKFDGIFVATEDESIMKDITEQFPSEMILSYKAGELSNTNGYIGDIIRVTKSADEAAIDYLMVLYSLNRCFGLIGGVCGATIVAQYKRDCQYDYLKIYDFNMYY